MSNEIFENKVNGKLYSNVCLPWNIHR